MSHLDVKFKKLDPDAIEPTYAYDGDAGLDLYANVATIIKPNERALIPTGISLELPEGYAALVVPRSGLAVNNGITVVNSPGLIDYGYRGEIKVVLLNTDDTNNFEIEKGARIAQLVILPIPRIHLIESEALEATSRGEGGFGSSGI